MPAEHPITLAEALDLEARGQGGEATRQIRVRHGIYGMRDRPGRYLVRLRLPAGIATADQLEALAPLAEEFGDPPRLHITTRQGLEFYGLEGGRIGALLEMLQALGLSTRNSGGNVLRGVVCCAHAGQAPGEPFDVTPYALAVDRAFRDDPRFQQLPRKMKISFEGCPEDHVHTAVSDIGLRAEVREGRRGFRITIGGGLGASPMLGTPLEPFTPAELLLPTITAILIFFNAHGNRTVRARARLKWLLKEWGADRVRAAIFAERGQEMPIGVPDAETPPAGRGAVGVRIPLGDLLPGTLRTLARIARAHAANIRLTIDQNVVLRDVPRPLLPSLRTALQAAGLAPGQEERLIDITRCAGRATCTLGLTDSRAAAELVAAALEPDLARHPDLQGQRIRISGCANACAHHHWADIGLFGLVRRLGEQPAPHYALVLGGGTDAAPLGLRVAEIPANQVGTAVRRVLSDFLADRQAAESFGRYALRRTPAQWQGRLGDLAAAAEHRMKDGGQGSAFRGQESDPSS